MREREKMEKRDGGEEREHAGCDGGREEGRERLEEEEEEDWEKSV